MNSYCIKRYPGVIRMKKNEYEGKNRLMFKSS